eukprot:SAG11_NODE_7555_length_1129_cov_2.461165_1_plen_294_part_00
MRNTLPVAMRAVTTDEMITSTVKSIIRDHCGKQYRADSPPDSLRGRVLQRDVLRAKKYLRRACVSPVDKGGGRLAIMCPVVQHLVMQKSWPDEPERCTVLCPSTATDEESAKIETKILQEEILTYEEKNWSRIATLYGVRGGRVPAGCALPPVYAMIKLKAIVAATAGKHSDNAVKGRPIGPHTKHPLKNVYNRNATAHHYMLTQIRDGQRVSRLWSTSDYPRRLAAEQAAMQTRHTARGGGQLKFVDRFGDLDGMYTNCPHARMNAALRSNIQRLHSSTIHARFCHADPYKS